MSFHQLNQEKKHKGKELKSSKSTETKMKTSVKNIWSLSLSREWWKAQSMSHVPKYYSLEQV